MTGDSCLACAVVPRTAAAIDHADTELIVHLLILQEIEKVIPALDKKSNPVYLDTWEKALERFKEILHES